jgi:hypothetical protein
MVKYKLDNAIKLNKKYPTTFLIPHKEEIESIKVGDEVKLIFSQSGKIKARMWVLVTKKIGNTFIGKLDNIPLSLTLTPGQLIKFQSKHIIAIM